MTDPRIDELRQLLPRCMLSDWVRLGARAARWVREGRPVGEGPHPLDRLMEQARSSIERRELRAQTMPRPQYPPGLPITARKDDIVAAIRAHPVVVIAGETGSGKTTQIPKMCLEAGLGARAMIGCTQPRRVAALSSTSSCSREATCMSSATSATRCCRRRTSACGARRVGRRGGAAAGVLRRVEVRGAMCAPSGRPAASYASARPAGDEHAGR
jgi:hypothetical protein